MKVRQKTEFSCAEVGKTKYLYIDFLINEILSEQSKQMSEIFSNKRVAQL